MAKHRLPNGREVLLVRLVMVGTYSSWLEESPKAISAAILKELPERAASVLPPAKPLAVVQPSATPLPEWFCVAELESPQGVRTSDPDFNSRLYACWFMNGTDRSIDAVIESILPHVSWEQVAEDYDITFI
jgi:hypothetical protein